MPILEKTSQINEFNVHLKKLEKGDQIKLKIRRGKEMINIGVKISEIENRKIIESIKSKAGFLRRSIKLINH